MKTLRERTIFTTLLHISERTIT